MSLSTEDINALHEMLRNLLQNIAVPKPSRASEYYAALTLSIVLLREQVAGENVPTNLKLAAVRELDSLIEKRAALEDQLDPGSPSEALAQEGGS